MKFSAKTFKKRLSRKRKRTRRLRKYISKGGGTIPNTNPSLKDLKEQGAVFANPEKVDDYESFDLTRA